MFPKNLHNRTIYEIKIILLDIKMFKLYSNIQYILI